MAPSIHLTTSGTKHDFRSSLLLLNLLKFDAAGAEFTSAFGRHGGFFYELKESIHCIFAVTLLSAKPPGLNDYLARGIYALACQKKQAFPDFMINRFGFMGIETELNGCGDFVDILAAGPEARTKFWISSGLILIIGAFISVLILRGLHIKTYQADKIACNCR
jgi:hypothetical protein